MPKKYFLAIIVSFTLANAAYATSGTDYGMDAVKRYSVYSHILNTPLYYTKNNTKQYKKKENNNENKGTRRSRTRRNRTRKSRII